MSHISGLERFEYTNSSHRRSGPPRSTTTNPMAMHVQHTLDQIATFEISPKPFMPNAFGMELMIRPPAERPTKNMNRVR